MKVSLGASKATRNLSFQSEFEPSTVCTACGARADLAFVAHETDEPIIQKGGKYVSQLHHNRGEDELWVHDACCVAVYFCRGCLEPTAIMNQA